MQEFFTTRGRLRRRAYWGRTISLYGAVFILYALASQIQYRTAHQEMLAVLGVGLAMLLGLGLTIIQGIKRLHDTNLSGWWWLVLLVPGISYGLSIGMSFVPGTRGHNRFGPDPKGEVAYEDTAIDIRL